MPNIKIDTVATWMLDISDYTRDNIRLLTLLLT